MANALGKLKTATGPWLVAAVIVVGGFMYWLYAASARVDSGVVVADTVVELPRVADTTFVTSPERFSGERILLAPVTVADTLGAAALTIDLPGLAGYPLILDRPVLESEITVAPGDALAVAGSVYALTDSLLDVYVQRNFFRAETRPSLEMHSTFFLVDSLDYYAEEDTATTGESGS
ncbi:MAG: hypothetical protein PVJ64_02720 [Gemmatimonadales bacterium]|jgi:hypothetical protein